MEGHDSDRWLVRVQAWSGVTFAGFLLVHLFNQTLASFGAETYDDAQRSLERGYQWTPIEIALVIAPLLVHAAASIARIVRRRRRGQKPASNLRARLHRASGLFLLVFFAGHVTATRGASLFFGVYPRFAGIAYTLRWVPAFFWPYYAGLALAGLYHVTSGLGIALPILGLPSARVVRSRGVLAVVTAVGGLALIAALLAFGGVTLYLEHPEQQPYARLLQRLGFVRGTSAEAEMHDERTRTP